MPAWALLAYLVVGRAVHPRAARAVFARHQRARGNRFGMVGMAIAVVTTLVTPSEHVAKPAREIADRSIAIGGGDRPGHRAAHRDDRDAAAGRGVPLPGRPGRGAGRGGRAYLNPGAFGIAGADGLILAVSRIEMGLGVAIGAITFSGSVIAFLKLNGNMSRRADPAAARGTSSTSALLAAILGLIAYLHASTSRRGCSGR